MWLCFTFDFLPPPLSTSFPHSLLSCSLIPFFMYPLFLVTDYCRTLQFRLELAVFLPQPPEPWDFNCATLCQ